MILTTILFFFSSFSIVIITIIIVKKYSIFYNFLYFTEIDEFQKRDEFLIKASNHMNKVSNIKNKIILVFYL